MASSFGRRLMAPAIVAANLPEASRPAEILAPIVFDVSNTR